MLYVTIIKIIRSLFGWSTSRTYTHTYTRARSYAIHHVHVYCIYIQYQILGVLNTKRVVFGKLKPSAYTHTLIFFSSCINQHIFCCCALVSIYYITISLLLSFLLYIGTYSFYTYYCTQTIERVTIDCFSSEILFSWIQLELKAISLCCFASQP